MDIQTSTGTCNCPSRMAFTSGLQLPHPIPAPVSWQSCLNSLHPDCTACLIFPSPTFPQEQTIFPTAASLELLPLRSSCLFFDSSVFSSIRLLNSANSDLSPIKIAPTNLSWCTIHFL